MLLSKTLKTLITLFLCVFYTILISACDDDLCSESGGDETDDYYGGNESSDEEFNECETEGGSDGQAGTDGNGDLVYSHLVVVDTSSDFNQFGTPGADLCDVVVNCGERLRFFEFEQSYGESPVCSDSDPTLCVCESEVPGICEGVDRVNPSSVENGLSCNGNDVNNESPYYSLGVGGTLILDYDNNLSGCSVSLTERQGNEAESYTVYACTESNFDPARSEACVEVGRSNNRGEVDAMIP